MNTRKSAILLLALVLLGVCCTVTCKREQTGSISNSDNSHETPIELSILIRNEALYIGKKVTVSGILFTHEEGPWLATDWRNPLVNTLKLKISKDSRLIAPPGLNDVWWFNSPSGDAARGYLATVEGILTTESQEHSSGNVIKKSVLEVLSASVSGIEIKK